MVTVHSAGHSCMTRLIHPPIHLLNLLCAVIQGQMGAGASSESSMSKIKYVCLDFKKCTHYTEEQCGSTVFTEVFFKK